MFSDVEIKRSKGNKIFFTRDSESLQDLMKAIRLQNHRVLVLWALDCASQTLAEFETLQPNENRPRLCLKASTAWAQGQIKMKLAKEAILNCHKAAQDMNEVPAAFCHGIGQAGSTVHVETHAIGLPIYELTALVLDNGKDCYQKVVRDKIEHYQDRLDYWSRQTNPTFVTWAPFLLENRPNKEQLRWEKQQSKNFQNESAKENR